MQKGMKNLYENESVHLKKWLVMVIIVDIVTGGRSTNIHIDV